MGTSLGSMNLLEGGDQMGEFETPVGLGEEETVGVGGLGKTAPFL